MIQISNSEIETWKRCPRKWYLTYYLGVQPAAEHPVSHRLQGTRVHLALQAMTEAGAGPLTVLDGIYHKAAVEHPEYERELRAEQELSKIMVDGLAMFMASDPAEADLEVTAAEREVVVPLPGLDGVELRAKLDQAVRRRSDGALLFRDWKTSGTFDRHEVLEQDPQMRRYSLVMLIEAGAFDHQMPAAWAANRVQESVPMGGIITTLRRCKRSGASRPPYYRSDQFRYGPDVIVSTYLSTRQLCGEIMTARAWLAEAGPGLDDVNDVQRGVLRPVWLGHDCAWSCPFASGLCQMMDNGAAWPEVITRSGRYVQGDPYAHYARDGLRDILAAATVGTASEGEDR